MKKLLNKEIIFNEIVLLFRDISYNKISNLSRPIFNKLPSLEML